jgi:2-iminoacetate synthase ThiH
MATLQEATIEELAEELKRRLSPEGIVAAAIDRHTKQVELSTVDVVTELKFIGMQLVHMYERHFDTVG